VKTAGGSKIAKNKQEFFFIQLSQDPPLIAGTQRGVLGASRLGHSISLALYLTRENPLTVVQKLLKEMTNRLAVHPTLAGRH